MRLAVMGILLLPTLGLTQGGSAVITLVMPPGGESAMGAEAGVNQAFGAFSGLNNPALLPFISDHTLGLISFSNSETQLLPVLNFEDLRKEARALALTLPKIDGDIDLGVAGYFQQTNFGTESFSFLDTGLTGTFLPTEWVARPGH